MQFLSLLPILELGCIYGIAAIGLYWSFRLLNYPDLSCDGSFVLGAIVAGVLIQQGVPLSVSWICATLAGAVAGAFTAFLHTLFKIPPLLSGILTAFMLYSVNLRISGNVPNIALFDYQLSPLFLGILALSVWGGCALLLKTHFGLALRCVGQNTLLARQHGLSLSFYTFFILALSNALIALSGALFSVHQGFVDISQGMGTLIVSLAAILMGERIFNSSSLSIKLLSALLGAGLYRLFIYVILQFPIIGFRSQDLNILSGLLIIGIIYGSYWRQKKKGCQKTGELLCST